MKVMLNCTNSYGQEQTSICNYSGSIRVQNE